MKKRIFVIIGDGKCGKSSVVRALTGVYHHKDMLIRQSNQAGDILVGVWSQSAQEGGYSPEDILRFINDSGAMNILLVLRFVPAPLMAPFSAIEYYELIRKHHNISQIVFMGPHEEVPSFPTTPNSNTLNLCKKRPINANAAMIREWWGWI